MLTTIAPWLWLLAQVVSGSKAAPAVSWSSDLNLTALSGISDALARPLDGVWEVRLAASGKRQIKTCRDFLSVSTSQFDLENDNAWSTLWFQGARCFALDALKAAKPASRSFLGWFRFSAAAIAKLPPRLAMLVGPDDLEDAAAAEKACKPWREFDGSLKIRVQGPDHASLRSDGWTGNLVLYARADLDGDGLEDLLIRRDGHVAGGSAADSSVFVVTQTSPTSCPRITRLMGIPRQGAE